MAKANSKTPATIPQDVKGFLIALAICKGSLRQTRTAIQVWRDRIEAKMPGGSRLASNATLVADLIREGNELAAKRAGKGAR